MPGKLPDPRSFCLRPDGQLPHLRDVEGAQRPDLGLLWQDYAGRPCPAGSGRQRLCDLSLAHRNCTGALFCTVLRKRCRTSWQDLRLMGRAVRGILLLCVRQKIPGKKPVVCLLNLRPERGVLTRSIFFSSGAFSRSVFWARCCTRCCRCRCLPVCTVWCCCWQP